MKRILWGLVFVCFFCFACDRKCRETRTMPCDSLPESSMSQTITGYVVLNSKGQILLTRGGEDWNTRQIELIPCGEDDNQFLKKWILGWYDSHIHLGSYGDVDSLSPLVMWMTVEGKYLSRDTSLKYPKFIINFAALIKRAEALKRIDSEKKRAIR